MDEAEESIRLNPRGIHLLHAAVVLRSGLEALEHSAVTLRGLARSLAERTPDDRLLDDTARPLLAET